MRFIKKKNMHEGEELLFVPRLHWMYVVKVAIYFLLLVLAFLIAWAAILPFGYRDFLQFMGVNIGYKILLLVVIATAIMVWRVFLYLCTEYGVTNRRLLMKRGIIRVFTAEIPTDRIESIYCIQGLLGRIFNYGTIYISGIGGKMPVFYMIWKPYAVRRKIIGIVEKNKTITLVHGELPKAKPVAKPEPVEEEEPIYRYGSFVRVLSDNQK